MDVIVDNISLELEMRLEELLAKHVQVIRFSIQDCYSVSMNPPLTDKLDVYHQSKACQNLFVHLKHLHQDQL